MSAVTSQQQVDAPEQPAHRSHPGPVQIGAGDPVGAGKAQLIERITRAMSREVFMAAVIDDIYMVEDAKVFIAQGVPPVDRIVGLEIGGCSHAAIREDTSMNEAAIAELVERHPDLEVVLVELGGDNLSATSSPELVDFLIYAIDVAQGEKIPRKAGQRMIRSGLFVTNKTDLALHVGVDLAVTEADSKAFRGDKPLCSTNPKTDEGLEQAIEWIHHDVFMTDLGP